MGESEFVSHRAACCAAIVCALLVASAHGIEYGIGPGGANYQYAWSRATVPAAEDEMEDGNLATADSVCWFSWIPKHETIEAHSKGQILADNLAQNKAWCQLTHRDTTNEYGGGISCGADVETFTPFVFNSATMAAGETFTVNMDVSVNGELQASEGGNLVGMETKAGVETLIGIIRKSDNALVLEVEGEAWWSSTYEAEGVSNTLDPVGMLKNACTTNNDICTVNYQDTLTFDVEVGEEYWLYFDLSTGVHCSDWPDGYSGPLDTIAVADFYNTSSYEITTSADAEFVVLPEPATLSLLGMGTAIILRRRK